MIVISDTSPLIAFGKLNQFIILHRLFQNLLIPFAVQEEYLKNCPSAQKSVFQQALETFIKTQEVQNFPAFSRNLGQGEQEVLALAIECKADILIMDDRKAVKEAKELGLMPFSTRAVLLLAERRGVIPSFKKLEIQLKSQNFFLTS